MKNVLSCPRAGPDRPDPAGDHLRTTAGQNRGSHELPPGPPREAGTRGGAGLRHTPNRTWPVTDDWDGLRCGKPAWIPGLATGQPVDARTGRVGAGRLGHAPQVIWTPTLTACCTPPNRGRFAAHPPRSRTGTRRPRSNAPAACTPGTAPDDAGMLDRASLRRGRGVRPRAHGRQWLLRRAGADRCGRHANRRVVFGVHRSRIVVYRRRPSCSRTTPAMI